MPDNVIWPNWSYPYEVPYEFLRQPPKTTGRPKRQSEWLDYFASQYGGGSARTTPQQQAFNVPGMGPYGGYGGAPAPAQPKPSVPSWTGASQPSVGQQPSAPPLSAPAYGPTPFPGGPPNWNYPSPAVNLPAPTPGGGTTTPATSSGPTLDQLMGDPNNPQDYAYWYKQAGPAYQDFVERFYKEHGDLPRQPLTVGQAFGRLNARRDRAMRRARTGRGGANVRYVEAEPPEPTYNVNPPAPYPSYVGQSPTPGYTPDLTRAPRWLQHAYVMRFGE
jgi:hypothetical protein